MDRSTSEKDKSSKRSRDERDRDSGRDHRDREHKHRSRDKDRDGTSSHHHRSEREGHHRDRDRDHHRKSSRREDREGSRDRESKREQSIDLRDDREGSSERVDRSHDRRRRDERERSRERSYDGRDGREGSRDRHDNKKREVKRERSYDGVESREVDDVSRRKRKDREDGVDEREKKEAKVSDGEWERRRFGDKLKEENDVDNGDNLPVPDNNATRGEFSEVKVKEEVNDESIAGGGTINGRFPADNGAASGSLTKPSSIAGSSVAPDFSVPIKVSSISNTTENKGVSITRSHEVPGKSSTDGTSSTAGKSGSSSLDALAKAKKAIEMKKELQERLKRMRMLSKANISSSDGTNISRANDGWKVPFSTPQVVGASSTTATIGLSATAAAATPLVQPASSLPPIPGLNSIPNYEAVRRAQELAAKMGFRQDPEFAPLINMFPGQMQTETAVPQKPTKAPVLRVDALGREIDEHGNIVSVTKPSNLSTLKVNINKQKKDAFQILKPELEVDPDSNPHFDERMGINKAKILRPKRMSFQFVEEGKWSKDAESIRLRHQFGEERARDMKARQALHAKAKAAPDVNPNLIEVGERVVTKEKAKDPIPEIEWWDLPLLVGGVYGEFEDGIVHDNQLKKEKITIYVEHPRPIDPPAEQAPPPPQPLKLTKKEQKKLRTQRRLAREKDRQEMIRQGLLEPPKPKVKMSNLMKVLGSEATQDPTKLEKEIRSAAADREQAHIDRNIARKLTPSERREKKERKLFDDPNTVGTLVSVYKINDLSHKKTRFKVDVNASHNHLTGCCVISEGINVVVVEGGSKAIKRYGNLMLRRINWAEAVNEDEGEDGVDDDDQEKPGNKCVLVWQGIVAKPSFSRFSVHECMTEAAARKIFADAGVVQYWDLSISFSDGQV